MKLYLIRHGEAAPLGEGGIEDDALRPLTDLGRTQARTLAIQLQKRGVTLDRLVTSPLLRARQTAETLLAHWQGCAPELEVCDDLAIGNKRRDLARRLRILEGESIALVGHQPDLGMLAGWLIGSKNAQIEMAKGGIAHILTSDDIRKGSGALLWMLTPEWLGS